MVLVVIVLNLLATTFAFPSDAVFSKFDSNGPRYDYLEDDAGNLHLVDNWIKMSDLTRLIGYNPDNSNRYHLFTRANPSVSQVLIRNNPDSVSRSHFDGERRTIVLMHGFLGSATSDFNTVLVPAFLAAEDVNVIVLDWSAGSAWGPNARQAGQAAGRFINWLNGITGARPDNYHLAGYSVGGHGVGIIARTIDGNVSYVTALDPAARWNNAWLFRKTDGEYTEVIHTNINNIGFTNPLGHVDFYPNGGRNMPGCITAICDHNRSYFFMGESLRTGGFTGRRCASLQDALNQRCTASDTLSMGGIAPKAGQQGIFHLRTNSRPPFSRG